MDMLVSTEWLAGELGKPDLVVFDCSTFLPGEPGNKHDAFRAAHIPGARLFDIDAIADDETDLPHMVPTPAKFARMVGALGVSNGSRVVFYDQHGLRGSPRGWWMMRLFGHDRVAVLDCGLPAWKKEGRPVETGDAPAPKPASFVPDFRASMLKGIGDIKRIVADGSALILDARPKGRFTAEVPEPRAGL
ncbi:MAG: sulfurtransferase, partial [Rhodospirillales bacterium]|nr:sulfurtransferase [Rhodospirillales bacterium]